MKVYIKILSYFIVLVLTKHQIIAQEFSEVHKDSLEIQVKKYYSLNLKAFQLNSTEKDIQKIFELFTKDFTYIHPKYGGIYSRKDLYNGHVRNQKNGIYNGAIIQVKIKNKIIGLNVVVVKRIYVLKSNKSIREGKPQVTLFEFKRGKISKIFEYW